MKGMVKNGHGRQPFKAMALMSAILSQLVGFVLIGVFLGKGLDRLVDSDPLFLILGILSGVGIGTYTVIFTIRQFFTGE
jgi:F0F1-type ATP synthase assembly protein I